MSEPLQDWAGEPPDDDLLAAEYVLGVLPPAERLRLEARLRNEPAFALKVAGWIESLHPLTEEVAPVAPPKALRKRIERRAFAEEGVVEGGFWSSLGLWRGLTGLTTALAVAAIAYIAVERPWEGSAAPAQTLVAALQASSDSPTFLASYDRDSGALSIRAVAGARERQRVPELWLIAPGDAPRSLGVIPPTGQGRFAVQPALQQAVNPAATLAISLEPPGGSPTGAPTGPVIASGRLQEL